MIFRKNIGARLLSLMFVLSLVLSLASPVFAADCTLGYTPGDANGDGKVNVKDVMTILKYVASWNVNINLDNADVLNDSKVNVRDAMLILKVSAGWTDVRLGHKDEIIVRTPTTCTTGGLSTLKCTICGSEQDVQTRAPGHNYKDGICLGCGELEPAYESYYALVDWIKQKGTPDDGGNYTFIVDKTLDLYGYGDVTFYSLLIKENDSTVVGLSKAYQPDNQSFYQCTLLISPAEKTAHTLEVEYFYVDGADIKYHKASGTMDNSKNVTFNKTDWGYSDSDMNAGSSKGSLSSSQITALKELTATHVRSMFIDGEFDLMGSNVSLSDFGFIFN